MMSSNSSTVYVRYPPNYIPQTPGIDLQQQQRSFSFFQGQTKDEKSWMAPVTQQQLQVQSLPGSMTGICLQQPTHNSMMLSAPFCPIYFPNAAAALQATNYHVPMQFIQAPNTMESLPNSVPDIKDPTLLKSAVKSPPSVSEVSCNVEFTPSSSIKMLEQLNLKKDIRQSNSGLDNVFSPTQQSGISNLGSPTLSARDDDDDLTSIRSDEDIELMTPDPERKFHINKEYLADLAIQAQQDPDVFGKISFVVFQELVDSEFLSPCLKQKARHYRRRHRNKLAAKICRDKKQTKIKDLNGEIDDLKKQIYMVKSERDMLRNEVEKLSEVHMKKGDKD